MTRTTPQRPRECFLLSYAFRLAVAAIFATIPISLAPRAASATTITYAATDLPDLVSGQDLWQYAYRAEGVTFDAGFGFSIFFDFTRYSSLDLSPVAPNADWDVLTLQPDLNLPDDGLYDALSLVSSASLSGAFVISFVWLGPGNPGPQPFVIYRPDFMTIESSTTVPEPASSVLLAIGLVVVALRRSLLSTGTRTVDTGEFV